MVQGFVRAAQHWVRRKGLASLSGESSREMTGCELAEDLEPQDFSRIAPHSLQL